MVCHPKHVSDGGAVEVAIAEANFEALAGERYSEVRGYGGLADAPFAGGDSDDVFDAGKRLFDGSGVALGRWVFDVDADFYFFGAP